MDRICRVEWKGQARHAVERDGRVQLIEGNVFETYSVGEVVASPRFLAPVEPSKIVAVGLNYRDHAIETNKPLPAEPMIFIKPSTAVIGPGDSIRIPRDVGRVDHEAEVGVVIRTRAFQVPASRAHEVILGITCVNDVTARELQSKDVQFTRSKGFDTFAPVGPVVAPYDGRALQVEGWVNGERRQASSTRELIFSIEALVAFISGVMTLLPGDIISTGTPSGIGPIKAGDRVAIKVEGVGELMNPVVDR